MLDLFTEEQLPRGTAVLVGRRMDGQEIGMVIDLDRLDMHANLLKAFRNAILYGVHVDVAALEKILSDNDDGD